jgi:hypothetical protein
MTLGFKRQFETYVQEGSKRHSIRGKGGREWKRGDVADCFVNPRQKTMRLLGRFPVVKVEDISIRERKIGATLTIEVAGSRLSEDEAGMLAWRDGFRDNGIGGALDEMAEFWRGRLPFEGVIIHWEYAAELAGPNATRAASRAAARALGVAA